MLKIRASAVLLIMVASSGCGWFADPSLQVPPVVVNSSPKAPIVVSNEASMPQQTLKQPADARATKPSTHPPGGARSFNPRQQSKPQQAKASPPARRDPTAPRTSTALPRPAPEPRPVAPKPQRRISAPAAPETVAPAPEEPPAVARQKPRPSRPAPRLTIAEPGYPTAAPRTSAVREAPQSERFTYNSRKPDSEQELFLLDGSPAHPLYMPPFFLDNTYTDRLLVQFDIGANGRFRVAILEGTGDPELDAQALAILQQWRWQPEIVGGRPRASTEVITFHGWDRTKR